ncbi:MAG TPA: ABC transporter ATP-binding protein [Thermoanaerobaculia bacterium]|nr:ABC transporter ATP-binding protein [Thermoanaerobaculia bacterium]
MAQPVIEVEHLSKRYVLGTREFGYKTLRDALTGVFRKTPASDEDELWALRDVSFQLHEGEALGIIGRNGSGKSTLLKILSRITHPTTGRARLRGRVASLLEVGTGFHPELTGRENVYLNGAILGMSQHEIRRNFDQIVAFAEIEQFLDTPVKRYSSGMYVRLAFAVAAHLTPEILIVDEVLAVGDTEFQRRCLGRMHEVATSGRTVLYVSHNLWSVEQLCNRAILLSSGRLVRFGKPSEIIAEYSDRRGASSWDVSAIEDRSGTGSARITHLELLATDAHQTLSSVEFLKPFRVRIHFEARRPIARPDFGLAVLNERGERILVCMAAESGCDAESIDGIGWADCIVMAPCLLPRTFRFEAWIIDVRGLSFADRVEMVGQLDVGLGNWTEHEVGQLQVDWRGSIYVPSEWQIKPTS